MAINIKPILTYWCTENLENRLPPGHTRFLSKSLTNLALGLFWLYKAPSRGNHVLLLATGQSRARTTRTRGQSESLDIKRVCLEENLFSKSTVSTAALLSSSQFLQSGIVCAINSFVAGLFYKFCCILLWYLLSMNYHCQKAVVIQQSTVPNSRI